MSLKRLVGEDSCPKIAVAVSGGSDSLALTFLTQKWMEKNSGQITTLTVDHNLRAESTQEAHQVKTWMKARGIPHHILTWHPKLPVKRLQETARQARYHLLNTWCVENGFSHLLTAHHADDQLETFLQRLGHGSGLSGLTGIQPILKMDFGTVLRPLLDCPKSVLTEYLKSENHPFIQDPSNENRQFSRVILRHNQPILESLGLTNKNINKTIQRLWQCEKIIRNMVAFEAKNRVRAFPFGYQTIDLERWDALDCEIRQRLISQTVQSVRHHLYPPPFKAIEAIDNNLLSGDFRGTTLGGCHLFLKNKQLYVIRENRNLPEPRLVEGHFLWDQRFSLYSKHPITVKPLGRKEAQKRAHAMGVSSLVLETLPAYIKNGKEVILI